jgi:phospholipid/cholesterol/gamma-HCH transport system ATP-binding protein
MDAATENGARRKDIVLSFEEAMLPLDEDETRGLLVDLALRAGDMVMLDASEPDQELRLADVACGLVMPMKGAAKFLGHDWSSLTPDRANAMRGRIGCALDDRAWLPHLTMRENILLPQLHHTRRSVHEIEEEAVGLAVHFGLPGLPLGLPKQYRQGELRRSLCIRALLGEPYLILLGRSVADDDPRILGPLLNALCATRERDAAVLWVTDRADLCSDSSIGATQRLKVRGNSVVAQEAEI